MKFKRSGRAINDDGTLTPEFVSALQPSQADFQQTTTDKFLAIEQCTVYLPSSQLLTYARGLLSVNITTATVVMNPGDVITLSASQTLNIIPL
ncbi:MAG: hypothetical protein WC901_01040 [Candidatus Margulisiibacteriota bacterium]